MNTNSLNATSPSQSPAQTPASTTTENTATPDSEDAYAAPEGVSVSSESDLRMSDFDDAGLANEPVSSSESSTGLAIIVSTAAVASLTVLIYVKKREDEE